MSALLTVDEALALIAAESQPLAPRDMPLRDAVGLILAVDVRSAMDSPPHDKALMDGYAVASRDRSPERRVLEEVSAGAVPTQAIAAGTATRIMTGASIPAGADAVVPVEQTNLLDNGIVQIADEHLQPGQHIMRQGESVRAGQVVVEQGAVIRALEIGICAEAGSARVMAVPHPRVAVLPTGNELSPIDQQPEVGCIRNSNGPMLATLARELGCDATEMDVARDDPATLTQAIQTALAADVVILTGGVSAGTKDLVPPILEALGVQKKLHKVAIKPGKPLWFGVKSHDEGRRTLVFGLPGNPVSSFVCFQVFVRPALASLAGRGFHGLPQTTVRLTRELEHAGGRDTYWPMRIVGEAVEPLPWLGSADLAAWAAANALLRIPADGTLLRTGQAIEVLPLYADFPHV